MSSWIKKGATIWEVTLPEDYTSAEYSQMFDALGQESTVDIRADYL